MIDWRDELRQLLVDHRYESSVVGRGRCALMEHHINALMDDLVPFIEERFAPDSYSVTEEGEKALAPATDEELADLLSLANVDVPSEIIQGWTQEQRDEAEAWAAATALAASDNPVAVPPRPSFLPAEGDA